MSSHRAKDVHLHSIKKSIFINFFVSKKSFSFINLLSLNHIFISVFSIVITVLLQQLFYYFFKTAILNDITVILNSNSYITVTAMLHFNLVNEWVLQMLWSTSPALRVFVCVYLTVLNLRKLGKLNVLCSSVIMPSSGMASPNQNKIICICLFIFTVFKTQKIM